MSLQPTKQFNDNDFVYVDVQNKKIIDYVTWDKHGNAEKREQVIEEESQVESEAKPKFKRKRSVRYYPWCSYATAKKVYNIEGKFSEREEHEPLDIVLEKALKTPYWNKNSLTDSEQSA